MPERGARDAPPHSIAAFVRGYEEERRLVGFRSACGYASATWGLRCPRCGVADLTETTLAETGRIVAVSVQSVPSEEFLNEAPYAFVLVELDDGARITGWIAGVAAPGAVEIGDRVRFLPSYKPGVQFVLEASTT